MSEVNIGNLIDSPQQRDAIHVAIAPVTATMRLSPGQEIGFVDSGTDNVGVSQAPLGIVDPYLKSPVFKGERFWMFLFPKTITALRHEWTHPAFERGSEAKATDRVNADAAFSRKWLEIYASRMNSYDAPEQAYARLVEGLKNRELFSHGNDLHGFSDLDDPEDLKMHAEKVLGIKIDYEGFVFSCSC